MKATSNPAPIDWGAAMQDAASEHLQAVDDAYWRQEEAGEEFEVPSPAVAPYCGCGTCVIREILAGAWPVIEQYARTVQREQLEEVSDAPASAAGFGTDHA